MEGGAPSIIAQNDSTGERLRLSRTGFARGGDMKGAVGVGRWGYLARQAAETDRDGVNGVVHPLVKHSDRSVVVR